MSYKTNIAGEQCQPRPDLRGVSGWYWVRCGDKSAVPTWWESRTARWIWRDAGRYDFECWLMTEDGWVCDGPAATPDEVAALRHTLEGIAAQRTVEEMTKEDYRNADFEGAYDGIIEGVRIALKADIA